MLRRTADEERKSIVATLYQAGNGIYSQFDKVLVLAEGREIYYGPSSAAKQYFESMGFRCAPGANIADFLTSVAVHMERKILPGFENRVPNTPEDFETAYRASVTRAEMIREIKSQSQQSLAAEVDAMRATWETEKNRSLAAFSREKSPYHVSFGKQVLACTKRQVLPPVWFNGSANLIQTVSDIMG